MKYHILTESELDILNLLWETGQSMSRPEILAGLPDKDWNPNSIHQVLNSMMNKGILKVDGVARCGKGYGRTYAPTMNQTQYLLQQAGECMSNVPPRKRLLGVVASMVEDADIDAETISELGNRIFPIFPVHGPAVLYGFLPDLLPGGEKSRVAQSSRSGVWASSGVAPMPASLGSSLCKGNSRR